MKEIITFCISTLFVITAMAQERHVVMFYNVENLFDTINSPASADEDMLPLADRQWNVERYHKKLNDISHVISELATHHDYPAIIGLTEVENRDVLEELTQKNVLSTYKICHYDSPDERGVDVALLYRPDIFHIQGSKSISATTDNPTRDILTAWGMIASEEVFIAVVHWPSRIGGEKFTEPRRIACAQQLREIVDSVQHNAPATKIIVMGDMNDNPNNQSIAKILRAKSKTKNLSDNDLHTPFANVKRGSSVYNNRWNRYDNIIVSRNMLLTEGLHLQPIEKKRLGATFSLPEMLDSHGHPLPTYRGTEYMGGVSDHLPIYVIIGK